MGEKEILIVSPYFGWYKKVAEDDFLKTTGNSLQPLTKKGEANLLKGLIKNIEEQKTSAMNKFDSVFDTIGNSWVDRIAEMLPKQPQILDRSGKGLLNLACNDTIVFYRLNNEVYEGYLEGRLSREFLSYIPLGLPITALERQEELNHIASGKGAILVIGCLGIIGLLLRLTIKKTRKKQ